MPVMYYILRYFLVKMKDWKKILRVKDWIQSFTLNRKLRVKD